MATAEPRDFADSVCASWLAMCVRNGSPGQSNRVTRALWKIHLERACHRWFFHLMSLEEINDKSK